LLLDESAEESIRADVDSGASIEQQGDGHAAFGKRREHPSWIVSWYDAGALCNLIVTNPRH
jgi:hypothetical protein